MRALRIARFEGPDGLELVECPDPQPGPDEIAVRVHATGLNRADLLQSLGLYPAPPGYPQDIAGLEYAGEVAGAGPRVRRFKVGDRVMGIVAGGAFAERVVIHEREAMAVPEGLDFVQAAAIPETFMTAYDALVPQAGVRASETVLIHAVASGVGIAALQWARLLQVRTIGTSRTEAKLAQVKAFGMDLGIAVGDPPLFAEQVRAATFGRGADVVLDLVGGAYLPETVAALAPRARVMQIGTMAGVMGELPLGLLMAARATLVGTVLRARPLEEKISLARSFEQAAGPLFASGKLKPVVDAIYSAREARAAFERMRSNATAGKIVVTW
jgi:NADPH2:quinone reductase